MPPFLANFRIEGDSESLAMYNAIVAGSELEAHSEDNRGAWISREVAVKSHLRRVASEIQDLLDLFTGIMRLWANSRDRLRVKGYNYVDPNTGRSGGVLLNAYGVGAPLRPDALSIPTDNGSTRGIVVLSKALNDSNAARALSVIATGTDWWQLYLILEALRDGICEKKGKSAWPELFAKLAGQYDVSVRRLRALKQTINFHRHAAASARLPEHAWQHGLATEFVSQVLRDCCSDPLTPSSGQASCRCLAA